MHAKALRVLPAFRPPPSAMWPVTIPGMEANEGKMRRRQGDIAAESMHATALRLRKLNAGDAAAKRFPGAVGWEPSRTGVRGA